MNEVGAAPSFLFLRLILLSSDQSEETPDHEQEEEIDNPTDVSNVAALHRPAFGFPYETHLTALQAHPKESTRFSRPHEHEGRASLSRAAPPAWPQTSVA